MIPELVFHPRYAPAEVPHFGRLRVVAELAAREGLGRANFPDALNVEALRGLHGDAYIDAMISGKLPLAGSAYLPWSTQLLDACLHMLGGQMLGARLALEHGRAINLACGFHHSHPDTGGGFCVFNGLALVAHQFPDMKVAVLDCDEHGGDGTEAFSRLLPNLHCFSVYGSRFGLRSDGASRGFRVPHGGTQQVNQSYLEVIDQALDEVLREQPDLVIYQAGMDVHEADPRATLRVSSATIAARDTRIFSAFHSARVPVLGVLAGAYQADQQVADLYREMLRAADLPTFRQDVVLPGAFHEPIS